MTSLASLLAREPCAVTDGALATELERAGFDTSGALWSARALADAPELVRRVHRSYLAAGADIVTSAGYQASVPGFLAAGYGRREAERLLRLAVRLVKDERDACERASGRRALAATSAGPYGAYLADGSEYRGRYGVSRRVLADFHRERLALLMEEEPDLVAFETVPSLAEAEVPSRTRSRRIPRAARGFPFPARTGGIPRRETMSETVRPCWTACRRSPRSA